ncbi:MAG TPA: hypothetical protein PLQ93_13025 [Bacteroidia bacterium]|nr:hypothetical protein [Bacteroidia bacterium]
MIHAGDKLADLLKRSAVKIEEFQVQAALGKAEFAEKVELVKKDVLKQVQQLKADAHTFADRSKEKAEQLKARLEHLELQLALGKAESKEEWDKQKKKIAAAIQDLKTLISKT